MIPILNDSKAATLNQEGEESPNSYMMQRLSTIKETNQSAEKEPDFEKFDAEFGTLRQMLFLRPIAREEDLVAIKSIAKQMDIHRNGILYLKELVSMAFS